MLKRETVLAWTEIEHDLYEEDGHIFGIELDLFNDHIYFYHRKDGFYTYLTGIYDDIYDAIDKFNDIVKEGKEGGV